MTAELTHFLNDRYDAIEASWERHHMLHRTFDGGSLADPAVIADLASKRRIVNLLSPTWVDHNLDDCDICTVGRELAEPFADVDGWREDWRPVREGELLA